jgi:YD repeat-containing protein
MMKLRLRARIAWVCGALMFGMLAGCASDEMPSETLPMIAPGHLLTLPMPGDLGRSVEAAQLITVHQEGKTYVFEGHISVTPEKFLLVGVDGTGRRALTLTWDRSGKVTAETAPWMPNAIPPGPMLADIVVLYWPEAIVRRALKESGATLTVGNGSRTVTADGAQILRAEYQEGAGPAWSGKLRYRNDAWGYDIEVQSVELAP